MQSAIQSKKKKKNVFKYQGCTILEKKKLTLRFFLTLQYIFYILGDFLLFIAHFQSCYQQLTPCAGVWSALAH